MKTRKLGSERWFAASLVALGILGAACSAKEAGSSGETGAANMAGAKNEAGAASEAGAANEAGAGSLASGTDLSCDAYFDALVRCTGSVGSSLYGAGKLPESELSRSRERYRTLCADRLELPGTGYTGEAIAKCLSAIDADGCSAVATAACTFKGTLPAGSACVKNEQCEDSNCFSVEASCGAGGGPACGVCKSAPAVGKAVGEGEACGDGDGPGGAGGSHCAEGLVCNVVTGPFGVIGEAKCAPPAGEGADCYGSFACKAPLICPTLQFDETSGIPNPSTCQTPGAAGDPCFSREDCETGLVCPPRGDGAPGASKCSKPGTAGAYCASGDDCTADLGCVFSQVGPQPGAPPLRGDKGMCAPLTFAEPGEACDKQATHCRIGDCIGTCPAVIADGEACSEQWKPGDAVCDTFSRCVAGTCSPHVYPTCDAEPSLDPAAVTCPAPLALECPKAAPAEGDECVLPATNPGQPIQFSICPYDDGKTQCSCSPGPIGPMLAWTCSSCPDTQPVEGEACTPADGPLKPMLQCSYDAATCFCDPLTSQWSCGAPMPKM